MNTNLRSIACGIAVLLTLNLMPQLLVAQERSNTSQLPAAGNIEHKFSGHDFLRQFKSTVEQGDMLKRSFYDLNKLRHVIDMPNQISWSFSPPVGELYYAEITIQNVPGETRFYGGFHVDYEDAQDSQRPFSEVADILKIHANIILPPRSITVEDVKEIFGEDGVVSKAPVLQDHLKFNSTVIAHPWPAHGAWSIAYGSRSCRSSTTTQPPSLCSYPLSFWFNNDDTFDHLEFRASRQ